jgi:curved DNA-binding protein CbpA
MTTTNPFTDLGLPARPDLTDEQVRAAWRTTAAATHPDLPGGGDPERYAAAAAAYAQLRTGWGRSEAFADLGDGGSGPATTPLTAIPGFPAIPGLQQPPAHPLHALTGLVYLPSRIRHGRPLRLALRGAAAAALALLVLHLIPGQPAAPAVITMLITWFILTARSDLAPPPKR